MGVNNQAMPMASTGEWKSTAAMLANTPLTVLAPGSNTRGAVLLGAGILQSGSGTTRAGIVFVMKSGAAPTGIADGEVIGATELINDASSFNAYFQLARPVTVPAGYGIYCIAQDAQPAGAANAPVLRHARWKSL